MKLHFWHFFKLFPSSEIDFWPFLKWQKMAFVKKIFFREIDLFDFTSFFGPDFFKFSVPFCETLTKKLVFSMNWSYFFKACFLPTFARTLLPQNIVPDKIEYD